MSAGLPGVGLGGLFFVLSALLMPVFELGLTLRGRSSRERWRRVARQFALAVTMVGAVVGTYPAVRAGLGLLAGAGHLARRTAALHADRVLAFPFASAAVAFALLGILLTAGKVAQSVLVARAAAE